ncbi:hypothetical protein ACO0LG_05200 [Undibacterium sp. Ji42W]
MESEIDIPLIQGVLYSTANYHFGLEEKVGVMLGIQVRMGRRMGRKIKPKK